MISASRDFLDKPRHPAGLCFFYCYPTGYDPIVRCFPANALIFMTIY